MGRVGILGGTFNPPHLGHLALARAARDQLRLERVLLVPAATPPHKEVGDDPGARRRLAMCRLAATGEPGLEACAIELERTGPSYTVATLRALHADAPRDQLTFIAGGDMAQTLPSWRDPEEILELAEFAVAERSAAREQISVRLAGLRGGERVRFLEMEPVRASSTLVRERVGAGTPIDDLVPPAVAHYIASEGLYRPRAAPAGAR